MVYLEMPAVPDSISSHAFTTLESLKIITHRQDVTLCLPKPPLTRMNSALDAHSAQMA